MLSPVTPAPWNRLRRVDQALVTLPCDLPNFARCHQYENYRQCDSTVHSRLPLDVFCFECSKSVFMYFMFGSVPFPPPPSFSVILKSTMSNSASDVLRMYLEQFTLCNEYELQDFLEYYNMIERRTVGFAFNIARRCLSLAIVNSPLSVDRFLEAVATNRALPPPLIHLLRTWVSSGVDRHGHRLDHLYIDKARFDVMVQKELIRLDQEGLKQVKMNGAPAQAPSTEVAVYTVWFSLRFQMEASLANRQRSSVALRGTITPLPSSATTASKPSHVNVATSSPEVCSWRWFLE